MVESNAADRWIASGFADAGPDWESSEEKHVLMVSRHCCTRVAKQAAALHSLGWRVDSLSLHMPGILEGFDRLEIVRHEQEMTELIASSGAKIIHVTMNPTAHALRRCRGEWPAHRLRLPRLAVLPHILGAARRTVRLRAGRRHHPRRQGTPRPRVETAPLAGTRDDHDVMPMRKWTPPMPRREPEGASSTRAGRIPMRVTPTGSVTIPSWPTSSRKRTSSSTCSCRPMRWRVSRGRT